METGKANRKPRISEAWGLVFLAAVVWLFSAGCSAAQQITFQVPSQFPVPGQDDHSSRYPSKPAPFGDSSSFSPSNKRIRMLNVERHKELLSDAARLVKLAEELNQEIAASGSATMTPDQLRKLGEIAKLAKSVKEKMSYPVSLLPESPDIDRP